MTESAGENARRDTAVVMVGSAAQHVVLYNTQQQLVQHTSETTTKRGNSKNPASSNRWAADSKDESPHRKKEKNRKSPRATPVQLLCNIPRASCDTPVFGKLVSKHARAPNSASECGHGKLQQAALGPSSGRKSCVAWARARQPERERALENK